MKKKSVNYISNIISVNKMLNKYILIAVQKKKKTFLIDFTIFYKSIIMFLHIIAPSQFYNYTKKNNKCSLSIYKHDKPGPINWQKKKEKKKRK